MINLLLLIPTCVASGQAAQGPSTWSAGPYLMLDETLLAEAAGLTREINRPSRLAEPIVTGYEDGCFQPYVTVIRDGVGG
jgi:hypothetical protein